MTRLPFALLCLSSLARAGTIKGTVLFEGEPPEQPVLDMHTDAKCPKGHTDEAIVVAKGKLRDVIVRIKNGTTGAHAAPAVPVVLDQRDCMYTPRVVGLVAGQKLVARNSDNTFHNVHGRLAGKDLWNKPQQPKSADVALDASSAHAGDVIEIACDVHTWMKAYAVVQDSPYFAVTASDGTFEIKDLPEGTYTLETWHPKLGVRTLTVQIGKLKRGDVTARFSYKASEM